tara:strand:+ start:6340 stop:6699 length:360 start_codon:yes stop_codon:yes gene_type:complete
MRITESRLREVIRSVIVESSSYHDERLRLLIDFCKVMGIDPTQDSVRRRIEQQVFQSGVDFDGNPLNSPEGEDEVGPPSFDTGLDYEVDFPGTLRTSVIEDDYDYDDFDEVSDDDDYDG